MAKRAKKHKAARTSAAPRDDDPESVRSTNADGTSGESRVSLAVTVCWMLTTLATFTCLVGLLVAYLVLQFAPLSQTADDQVRLFTSVLYHIAVFCGLLTMALTWAAVRFRDKPTPRSVVNLALLIGATPPVSLAIAWISHLLGRQ